MQSVKSAVLMAACVLAVACGKDKGPGELLVNSTNNGEEQTYVIKQGETLEIPVELSNLAKGGILVAPYSTDKSYTASATKPEGPKFTLSLTAPSLVIEEKTFAIGFTAVDTVYNRTVEAEYIVSSQRASNFVEIGDRANTYIIKPGSIAMFPASLGNSSENADFDSASLLWQDTKGLVTKIVEYGNKIVAVLGENLSGNALVGASKGGENVWSWHLWVSDYAPGESDMTYSLTSKVDDQDVTTQYAMMDRNIGAMKADCSVDAHGLFYEWGRQEPFSAKPVYDIEGNEVEYKYVAAKDTLAAMGTTNLIDFARKTPMVFYKGAGNNGAKYSWFSNSVDEMKTTLPGNYWNSDTKSAYDPCPAGYKVPNYASFGFTSTFAKEKIYDGLNAEGTAAGYPNMMGWEYDNNGKKFYFPLQGDINQNGGFEMAYNPENTAGGYRYLRLWISNLDIANVRGYVMQAHSNADLAFSALYFNYGNAVRCIKE